MMDPSIANRIRHLAQDLDIAESYPGSMNISFDEAHAYVVRTLGEKLKGIPMCVSYVSVEYDQGLLNCLRGIHEKQIGIGENIVSVEAGKVFESISIKFDRPYSLLEV